MHGPRIRKVYVTALNLYLILLFELNRNKIHNEKAEMHLLMPVSNLSFSFDESAINRWPQAPRNKKRNNNKIIIVVIKARGDPHEKEDMYVARVYVHVDRGREGETGDNVWMTTPLDVCPHIGRCEANEGRNNFTSPCNTQVKRIPPPASYFLCLCS
jgi:hypothetical protein